MIIVIDDNGDEFVLEGPAPAVAVDIEAAGSFHVEEATKILNVLYLPAIRDMLNHSSPLMAMVGEGKWK